jgi:rod shape determining protein RodA
MIRLVRGQSSDPLILGIPLVLLSMGVTIIYSLTSDQVGFTLWQRQIVFVLVGAILGVLLWLIDYRSVVAGHWWLYGVSIALLIATLVVGTEVFGAKSWIDLGFFTFQAGEFAKLALIVSGSALLFGSRERYVPLQSLLLFIVAAFGVIGLILLQPDFGTTTVHVVITTVFLLVAPLRLYQRICFVLVVALALGIGALAYANVTPFGGLMRDYQRNRITNFLTTDGDRQTNYNVDQAVIAIGSGGMLGQGIGFGTQSQLNFLPVVHSDFIAAAIGEAWGFAGISLLIALITILCWRLVVLIERVRDPVARGIILGVAVLILYQSLVSIGMNIRIMPVTGIPLPFVSSGGTAVVTYLAMIGLILSINTRATVDREPQSW